MARSNDVEFTDNSVKVKAELEAAIYDFLRTSAAEIETQAIRYTKKGETGALARNWDIVVDKAKQEAIVGNKLEYAIYEEFGTGEYALEGNGRKGYWVFVKDGSTSKMTKSTKTYTLAQAKRIVAIMREDGLEAYYTKGSKPKRMLYKAFTMWKPKIEARAKQIFKSRGF